jgi:hypothetical protein
MKSIQIHPETPPPITITLPSIYDEPHISTDVKCAFCCESNKRCIIPTAIMGLIGMIIAIVVLKNSGTSTSGTTTSVNPCEAYKSDDMASGVSLACFRYTWANAACKTIVPDGYAGWYLRSPVGGKTVLCIPPNTGSACGAGSYGTIINTVWHCDLDFKGY